MGLLLLLIQSQLREQTSNALLELAILGGVDERVDEAVAEHTISDVTTALRPALFIAEPPVGLT